MSTVTIPQTGDDWKLKVTGIPYCRIHNEVLQRPVVCWFSNTHPEVLLLMPQTLNITVDRWVLNHFDNTSNSIYANKVLAPIEFTLERTLNHPKKEQGWIYCEFTKPQDFAKALFEYFESFSK